MVEQKTTKQIINDLIWVITSPVLFAHQITDVQWLDDEFCESSWDRCRRIIEEIKQGKRALSDYDAKKPSSFRLGHYFEYLVALWMNIDPRFDILAQNYVISNAERTLGELDFILFDNEAQNRIHLEVAVKFYIGLDDENEQHCLTNMGRWFGPSLKDRLDKKYAAMQWKQLAIGSRTNWDVDYSVGLIKGRVFSRSAVRPYGIAENVEVGSVLTCSQAKNRKDLIVASKSDWISLEYLKHSTRSIAHSPVQAYCNNGFCFVVPDQWYEWASDLRRREINEFSDIYSNAEYYIGQQKICMDVPFSIQRETDNARFFILTAFNPMHYKSSEAENILRNEFLKDWLDQRDLKFTPALGRSKGGRYKEPSFAISTRSKQDEERVIQAANLFSQRAMLKIEVGKLPRLAWCC